MSGRPLVSVIVPTYNREEYLPQCVDSIFAQTYPNVEAVLVNDGSTDGSLALMRQYEEKSPDRVVVVDQPNGGIPNALNAGIRAMRGEYFCWLSSDDAFAPDKVEAQLGIFTEFPDTGLVHTDFWQIDDHGNVLREIHAPVSDPYHLAWILFNINTVNGSTVMIPKTILAEVGVFDEALPHSQDYDLWLRIARRHPVRHITRPLIYYRIHAGQLTNIPGKNVEYEVVAFRRALANWTLSDWFGTDAARLSGAELAERLCQMGLILLNRQGGPPGGLPEEALSFFDATLRLDPDFQYSMQALAGKAEALRRLGVRGAHLGRLDEAERLLTESYALNPTPEALVGLASVLLERDQPLQAYEVCLSALGRGVKDERVAELATEARARLRPGSGRCLFRLVWEWGRPELWKAPLKAYARAFTADDPVSLAVLVPTPADAEPAFGAIRELLAEVGVNPEEVADIEVTAATPAGESIPVGPDWSEVQFIGNGGRWHAPAHNVPAPQSDSARQPRGDRTAR